MPQVGLDRTKVPGIDGVDVSAIQALIDYDLAHDGDQGYSFAWVKAGQGPMRKANRPAGIDPMAAKHYAGFRRRWRVGLYFFGKPWADPLAQAAFFADAAARITGGAPWQRGDLPPLLDLEVWDDLPPATVEAWSRAFLAEADKLFGTPLAFYTYAAFMAVLGQSARATDWAGRVIAQAKYDGPPITVLPFDAPTFIQYDGDEGHVPGVLDQFGKPVACDRDRYLGGYDDLVRLCGEEPAALPSLSDDPRVRA